MGNAVFPMNKRFAKLREVPDGPSMMLLGVIGRRISTGGFFEIWPLLVRNLCEVSVAWGVDSVVSEFLRDAQASFAVSPLFAFFFVCLPFCFLFVSLLFVFSFNV
jgi:hypothetical protein